MWQDFHFLTPLWFLALLPLGLLVWAAARAGAGANAWKRVIDPRLLAVLSVGAEGGVRRRWPHLMLAAGWFIAVVALANPTFESQPVPAFRTDAARVVALDLSRSMLADDMTPTRLDRARYKLSDILSRSGDGQVGLVAFAGDAFAVSPLTDDADTILAMLEALSPEIMPVQGSRPDLAITQGMALLQQSGAQHGEVILLTDDAGGQAALQAAETLRAAGHRLAVIGVGTPEGAVVPGVRTSQGEVVARLDAPALRALARAGGGAYSGLSADDADLGRVLRDPSATARDLQQSESMQAETWKELGPWIVLALLPLGALAFRRGWVLGLMLLLGAQSSLLMPRPAMALGWDDLWQRRDQQAAQALGNGEYERALKTADDPARIGTANYRLGDYTAAAEAFAAGDDAEHDYNRGNALARAGDYEQAVAAYEEALAKAPDLDDASYNKEQIERLLEQQKQEQQQSGQGQQDDPKEDQSGQDQSGQDQSGQDQSEQGPSEQEQSGQDQPEQNQSGQDQNGQNQSGGQGSDPQQADQTNGDQQPSADAGEPGEQPGSDAEQQAGGASGNDRGEEQASESPSDEADAEAAERAAADYRDEAAAQQPAAGEEPTQGQPGAPAESHLSPEEQESRQAADQWLRRIPDDPAGLLRRKFLYQYRARAPEQADMAAGNPW